MVRLTIFRIEDELHAEPQEGEFSSVTEAIAELKRRAELSWDTSPNIAPCANWKNCGRNYEVIEYDISVTPWRELQRIPAMEISAAGVKWLLEESES